MKLKLLALVGTVALNVQANTGIVEWTVNPQGLAMSPLSLQNDSMITIKFGEKGYSLEVAFINNAVMCPEAAESERIVTWETNEKLVKYYYSGCQKINDDIAISYYAPDSLKGLGYILDQIMSKDILDIGEDTYLTTNAIDAMAKIKKRAERKVL